ncbi:MAG: DUF2231 domain-containing protein [Gammaproteobacteria bacterium]|nr:DUF2231 domain-containing protein [Gammaproteobacteria bacterium]
MEIIPNWHPFFVHFTIALFTTAGLFGVLSMVSKDESMAKRWMDVCRWNLWLAMIITLVTIGAGIQAYNTVDHDTPSHLAMTEHKNWALITGLILLAITTLSVLKFRNNDKANLVLVGVLLVGIGMVFATAYRGAELVYKYGLGVQSLPKVSGEGHDHVHADGANHDHGNNKPSMNGADSGHAHDSLDMGHDSLDSTTHDEQHQHKAPDKKVHVHEDGQSHTH